MKVKLQVAYRDNPRGAEVVVSEQEGKKLLKEGKAVPSISRDAENATVSQEEMRAQL